MTDVLIDPDCRDGKHRNCPGGLCECTCHSSDDITVRAGEDF